MTGGVSTMDVMTTLESHDRSIENIDKCLERDSREIIEINRRYRRMRDRHDSEISEMEGMLQSHDRTIVGLILTSCIALGLSVVSVIVLTAMVMGGV